MSPAGKGRQSIARRYMQAWNDKDAMAIRSCFTRDGCYIDSVHEQEIIGDEIIAYAEGSFENFSDTCYEIIHETPSTRGTLIVQWIMTGVGIERLFARPVSGKRVSLQGLDLITLHRGRIKNCISYYDAASLVRGVDKRALRADKNSDYQKYERTRLPEGAVAEIRRQLETLVTERRVYADSQISLARLAVMLGVSPTYLSQVINREYGLHFRDFINSHRVGEAKLLLADPGKDGLSVLDIGVQTGFNSTSVYYAAFRKFAGMTPLQYRRARQSS